MIILLGTAFVLLLLSGVGGYGYQESDWLKHNAILRDLVQQQWPVIYEVNGVKAPLVYYIAYLLPAALVGKLGGWFLSNQALFLWSYMGLVLSLLWVIVLVGHARCGAFLLCIAFSGLDVIGQFIVIALARGFPFLSGYSWGQLEWWAILWQYPSNATLLFWVPNQMLAGWIISGLVISSIYNSLLKRYSVLYVCLTPLWSPFITIGILPYLVTDFVVGRSLLSKRLSRYISISNVCGFITFAAIGLFYISKFSVMPQLSGSVPRGFIMSFADNIGDKLLVIFMVLLFCMLEFGAYALFIGLINRNPDARAKGLFIATVGILSLLPFYKYGYFNDLVMRASIPALFLMSIFLGRTFYLKTLTRYAKAILLVLLCIGAITPTIEYTKHMINIYRRGTIARAPELSEVEGVLGINKITRIRYFDSLLSQYVGDKNSFFFKVMAK